MSNDAEAGVAHFRRTVTLAERLAEYGLALYQHEWYFDAFGSWTLVAGRRHRRFKFEWDGREFRMTVSTCENSSGGHAQEWTVMSEEHLGGGPDSAAFAYVETFFSRQTI